MEEAKYKEIEKLLPVGGHTVISNREMIEALEYLCKSGCGWRNLPKGYGSWHTIYMRLNRWAKEGVLERVYEKMIEPRVIEKTVRIAALDATIIKAREDGITGDKKKRKRG
jgi:transposase